MSRIEDTVWCDNCGVEILWGPLVIDHHDYCCRDCLDGLLCDCGDWMELEDDRRSGTYDIIPNLPFA